MNTEIKRYFRKYLQILVFSPVYTNVINLSYIGVLKTPSYDGGTARQVSPLFFCVKTIEKVIRLCTVFFFFFEW